MGLRMISLRRAAAFGVKSALRRKTCVEAWMLVADLLN